MKRIACNSLLRILKKYRPTGRRNQRGPLKRLLDVWDLEGSTSGPSSISVMMIT